MKQIAALFRTPELLILALAVMVAVAASSAVNLFSDRVERALESQSGEAFGADVILESRDPLPTDFQKQVDDLGMRQARTIRFPSVAFNDEQSALASVKAVDESYPLLGHLRTSDQPFGDERIDAAGPSSGEIWIDLRLWTDLDIQLGNHIDLGQTALKVTRLITHEPDRGNGFTALAPRLMMSLSDIESTGLITAGSRVNHRLMLAGSLEQLTGLKAIELPDGVQLKTAKQGRQAIRNALERSRQFLDIAVLSAMLLAAAAIGAAAHQHGARLRDEAAILKTLGASSGQLAGRALRNLLVLALVAGGLGILIGLFAQGLVAIAASGLTTSELPAVRPLGAIWSFALAILLVFGFAAPPWFSARHTPPIRIFQRRDDRTGTRLAGGVAALAAAALIAAHTGDLKLAGSVLAAAAASALVLGLAAFALVKLLSGLRARGGTAIRFGLANIARRQWSSVGQAIALGLALLALLLVVVVRSDLLNAWENRLPADAPNQFLINIQTPQVEPLRDFFQKHDIANLEMWPMARARLVRLRGEAVTAESFEDQETQRWINREFNLSWTDEFGDDNRLLEGQWWPKQTNGKAWISVDDYAVERLNLKLGDSMTLNFGGREVTVKVYNVRKVSWDSFRPNFFLVVPPGLIEGTEAQWLTSFYLPDEQRPFLRDMIRAFPNITALDLEAAMQQVRSILDRVVRAVEFLFLFTLAAGMAVLLAAIEGTRADRVRETALLRSLGASSSTVVKGLLAEYAALGLIAGIVAAAAAQALGWDLSRRVFELPYHFSFTLWLSGALGGSLLVSLLGWLSLRRTLQTPPRQVLASA